MLQNQEFEAPNVLLLLRNQAVMLRQQNPSWLIIWIVLLKRLYLEHNYKLQTEKPVISEHPNAVERLRDLRMLRSWTTL